jgi:hypothetical protein
MTNERLARALDCALLACALIACGDDTPNESTMDAASASDACARDCGDASSHVDEEGGDADSAITDSGEHDADEGDAGGRDGGSHGEDGGVLLFQDELLGRDCSFAQPDWRTLDGAELVVQCGAELGLLPVDGGPFERLAAVASVVDVYVSSTHLIAFEAGVLRSIPLAGGSATMLTFDLDAFNITADRTRVVFGDPPASSGEPSPLYAMATSGDEDSVELALVRFVGGRLSPDGEHVLFTPIAPGSSFDLNTVPIGGGTATKIGQPFNWDPSWSSNDGTLMAFTDMELDQLVLIGYDGSGRILLGDAFDDSTTAKPIAFTPDDSALLVSFETIGSFDRRTELHAVDGTSVETASDARYFDLIGFGPGGSVLSAQTDDNTGNRELWLWSATDNAMIGTLAYCINALPSEISPDGTRAAFFDVGGSFKILDLASGDIVGSIDEVTPVNTCVFPRWTPDSQRVVIEHVVGSSRGETWVVSNTAEILSTLSDEHPGNVEGFSPDSRYVVMKTSSANYRVYALASGERQPINITFGNSFKWLDGHRLVYDIDPFNVAFDMLGLHLATLP